MPIRLKNIIIMTIVSCSLLAAQDHRSKYWIYLAPKASEGLHKASASRAFARSIGISERAIERRMAKGLPALSEEDLPVDASYLERLRAHGVAIQNESRWLNAVTASLTDSEANSIAALPFVRRVEGVKVFRAVPMPVAVSVPAHPMKADVQTRYNYGQSLVQMQSIDAVAVHNIGISGRGVLVGMLDTGFRWKQHEALKDRVVVGEHDFIQNDDVTANQAGDSPDQDQHGTLTMSIVGGYREGKLVSPAFNAEFILGKTEYVPSETNVEEDNWVAAIEWMEQYGVDVVSSSLGYSIFDAKDANGDPQYSYVYNDMNGRTTVTAKAAAAAARKGVVVVNAMGNEGNNPWRYLTTPADADSILSVGAVNSLGTYASFSSIGPTSDGRIKPDVVADGVGTYGALPSDSNYTGSFIGTSLATPLVAGAAAMLLSAHPELTPVQVRDALRSTASNAVTPNDSIGWGVIDVYQAILSAGMVISTDPLISVTAGNNHQIGAYIVSHNSVEKDSVLLYYSTDNGGTFSSLPMTLSDTVDAATSSGLFTAELPASVNGLDVVFYIKAEDSAPSVRTSPYDAPKRLFTLTSGIITDTNVFDVPTSFALAQNYPNPFNPTTTIVYQVPAAGRVTLTVYDMLGRVVASLLDEIRPAGSGRVIFNASSLAAGVYLYRLRSGGMTETKKMVFIK